MEVFSQHNLTGFEENLGLKPVNYKQEKNCVAELVNDVNGCFAVVVTFYLKTTQTCFMC